LLEKQPELAKEAVPMLCRLLEEAPSAQLLPMPRRKILGILEAYGSRANEAAPVLAKRFCSLASATGVESEHEAQQTLRTMRAFGSDQCVIAQLPMMLAAAKSDRLQLEVARLIAALDPNAAISEEELARVFQAITASLGGKRIPEDDTVFVLKWAAARITKLPVVSALLHTSLAKLQTTIQESTLESENAIADLEAREPRRYSYSGGGRHGRHRIRRTNREWSAHQLDLQAARDRVEQWRAVDQTVANALNTSKTQAPEH
jgi:hypothetical protein